MTSSRTDHSHDGDDPPSPPMPSTTQLLRKARLALTQVAERSHFLALNARIEAARHHETGSLAAIATEMSEIVGLMKDIVAEIEAASAP